jgi:RNA polymerase sigma-70 factor (ECF subfamily)
MGTIEERRDDAQLLEAAAAGDGAAFSTFYSRHLRAVVATLTRETGADRELAADLAADVFATALVNATHYRPEHDSALPWLNGIARNKAYEARRRGRAQDRIRLRLRTASQLVAEDDLDRVADRADHDGRLIALLDQLPNAQRDALRARVIDERDYAEIARDSGSSEAAVRQRVSRALAWLRSQTIGTATALAVLVIAAAVAIAFLLGSGGGEPHHPSGGGATRSLPALLEVLRRPQAPGDRPAEVTAVARDAARRAPAPYDGRIEPGTVRRLATGPDGTRFYIAPVTPRKAGAPIEAAFVLVSRDDDTRVHKPWGLTASALQGNHAFYLTWPLRSTRAAADGPRRLRLLQVQVVPDGAARVEYTYQLGLAMDSGDRGHRSVTVTGNAAVDTISTGGYTPFPLEIVTRDRRERQLQRVAEPTRGRGEIAPGEVCRGVRTPAGPTRAPVFRTMDMTTAELCRQSGPPLRAYRSGYGQLLLLYPPDALLSARDGELGMLSHVSPDAFPPAIPEAIPQAQRVVR